MAASGQLVAFVVTGGQMGDIATAKWECAIPVHLPASIFIIMPISEHRGPLLN